MTKKKTPKPKNNGKKGRKKDIVVVNISGNANAITAVGGRLHGNPTTDAPPPKMASKLSETFSEIKKIIDQQFKDLSAMEKEDIKIAVEMIEQEAWKGDSADPKRLERRLQYLDEMAPDMLDVMDVSFSESMDGINKVIVKIIKEIKEKQKHSKDSS